MAFATKKVLIGLGLVIGLSAMMSAGWSVAREGGPSKQQNAITEAYKLNDDQRAAVIEVAEQAVGDMASGDAINQAIEPIFEVLGSKQFQAEMTSAYSNIAKDYPYLPPNAEFAPIPSEFNAAYLNGLRKEAAAGRLRCDQAFSASLSQDLVNITQVECKGRGKFRVKANFPKESSGEVEMSNTGIKVKATPGT
jgi:hypothetical protein